MSESYSNENPAGEKNPDYSSVTATYNEMVSNGHKAQADLALRKIAEKYPKGTNAPPQEILAEFAKQIKGGGLETKINGYGPNGQFASFFEGIGRFFSHPYSGPVAAGVTAMLLVYIL